MIKAAKEKVNTQVILVDSEDKFLGRMDKLTAHREGKLHRAYSILVFRLDNKVELLLQQRSIAKYHGGGLWTNTCCSHPNHENELLKDARKRLYEEMGIHIDLTEVGTFQYFAKLDNDMYEHEVDHVLMGIWVEQAIQPDPEEVSDYCWMNVQNLTTSLQQEPNRYTPWLSQALELTLNSQLFTQLTAQK